MIIELDRLKNFLAEKNHTHSGYLTSHQDITGKEDVANKSNNITTDTGSTTKYPTVKAVEDYAQPIGNYYTKTEVDGLLEDVEAGNVNLNNYYTKSEIDALIGDAIEIINGSGNE